MKKVKLIVLDVDGVLTDGKLYIGSDGEEYKCFHTQDGLGISLARHSGIKIALITGRTSAAVTKRAEELNIDIVYQGVHDKVRVLREIINSYNINEENVCYMGDDLNDLPILELVGLPAAPQNAVPYVKKAVRFISKANGGEGAVRELIDYILSEDDYHELLNDYFKGMINLPQ